MSGRPWQPGQSGNPHGRPRRAQTIADALREQLNQVTAEDGRGTRAEAIARTLIARADEGEIPAIRLLMSYTDGLPTQPVVQVGDGGDFLRSRQWLAVRTVLARLAAGHPELRALLGEALLAAEVQDA